MKIGFVGAPGSGKTTIAALVFAHLKDNGIVCEFVPEQARFYIASMRAAYQKHPTDSVSLSDEDQLKIMQQQQTAERIFESACGSNALIVSDSSTYNALLYMSDDLLLNSNVRSMLAKSRYDLLFYCPPVKTYLMGVDPNRVHSEEQSNLLDSRIVRLVEQKDIPELIPLAGNSDSRRLQVLQTVWQFQFGLRGGSV